MENFDDLLQEYNPRLTSGRKYALLTQIGNWATPSEMVRLFESEDEDAGEDYIWSEWLSKQKALYDGLAKPRPEPFVRSALSQTAHHFSTQGDCASKKKLVVAITGNAHRMMLPLCTFLQCFDAAQTDILLIDSRSLVGKIIGDPEPVPSFFEAWVKDIERHVSCSGPYAHHAIMGTSFGALPALMVGIMLGFPHVLSVGSGSPYDSWWLDSGSFDPVEFLMQRGRTHHCAITVSFGADSDADNTSAGEIMELAPVTISRIGSKDGSKIFHMCLHPLALAGILPAFLQSSLGLVAP
jgi:hypothetical protein